MLCYALSRFLTLKTLRSLPRSNTTVGSISLDRRFEGTVLCANPWSSLWFNELRARMQCCASSALLVCLCLSLSVFVLFRGEVGVWCKSFRPQVWFHKTRFVVCTRESLEFYSVLSLPSLIVLRVGDASQFWT